MVNYGLAVGLISIVALVAVQGVGSSVNDLFGTVADTVGNTSAGGSAGDSTPDACAATLSASDHGLECADGAFYAGNIFGNDLFVAATDEGRFAWNADDTMNSGLTSMSGTDGVAFSNQILADSEAKPAAQACADKSGGDWYLPSSDELVAIYANLQPLGLTSFNFNTDNNFANNFGYYRSSKNSNVNVNTADVVVFTEGQGNSGQMDPNRAIGPPSTANNFNTRCVRRG
ncbi:MAG: hypothetical protein Alpg2KO_16650 [Alphaproteobacteria bacterium]